MYTYTVHQNYFPVVNIYLSSTGSRQSGIDSILCSVKGKKTYFEEG